MHITPFAAIRMGMLMGMGPSDEAMRRLLASALEMTGMDVAYVGSLCDGREQVVAVHGAAERMGLRAGTDLDASEGYVLPLAEGTLGPVLHDGAQQADVLAPGLTAGVASLIGVPVRGTDGSAEGALCCLGFRPNPHLVDAHVRLLAVLADSVGAHLAALERHKQDRRMQDDFLALISHELRTPLTALSGYAELLTEEPPAQMRRQAVAVIRRSSLRLEQMVDDLLLLSRLRTDALQIAQQQLELGATGEHAYLAAMPRAEAAGVTLRFQAPERPLLVLGDEQRMALVFDNLLQNAIHYTPPDGQVDLRMREEDGWGLVEVVDNGLVLSADECLALFEPYFRPAGQPDFGDASGLDLAVAAALVAAHGGSISAAPEPGRGTRVTVRLSLIGNGETGH